MNVSRLALALVVLAAAAGASAQTEPRVVVDAGFVSQSYSTGDTQSVSEATVPLSVAVGVGRGLTVSLRTVYASVSGDGLESLSGLGDTQVGVGFQQPLGLALVDVTLGASLPTGQTALTDAQFATSASLAVDDYAFALPTLGQGAVVSPSVALAVPMGAGAAFGIGAAYSARSSYTLFDADTSSYAPAGETILTVGLDASVSATSTFTLEGSYVLYGDDSYRGETFSPGDKASATMRIESGGRLVRTRLLARYRHVFDGAVGAAARPVSYRRPSQAPGLVRARVRAGDRRAGRLGRDPLLRVALGGLALGRGRRGAGQAAAAPGPGRRADRRHRVERPAPGVVRLHARDRRDRRGVVADRLPRRREPAGGPLAPSASAERWRRWPVPGPLGYRGGAGGAGAASKRRRSTGINAATTTAATAASPAAPAQSAAEPRPASTNPPSAGPTILDSPQLAWYTPWYEPRRSAGAIRATSVGTTGRNAISPSVQTTAQAA